MNYSNNLNRPAAVPPSVSSQFNFSQFQSQPIFPQPSGNIYFVSNSMEVANIPIGAGMSAVLCLPENLFYVKSMQNGVPSLLGYKISPLETPAPAPVEEKEVTSAATTENSDATNLFKEQINKLTQEYDDKIKSLEDSIKNLQDRVGGLVECKF